MFLIKMRFNLPDRFVTVHCGYSSRQVVSMAVQKVRKRLEANFVPDNTRLNAINRQTYIDRHVTSFHKILYNPNPNLPQVIVYIDGTYAYCYKSFNLAELRKTYSQHKFLHLVKPVLEVAPDGYMLDIHGPYFANANNNDAALLRKEMENSILNCVYKA